MPAGAPRYRSWTLTLPGDEEDRVVALLWQAGTLGVESFEAEGGVVLRAWFASAGTLPALPEAVVVTASELVEESDWLAPWRSLAEPLPVGRRFLIDPREPDGEAPAAEDRTVLRVPARRAFGTGSHPTTRLMIEALEDLEPEGRSVLDVGCGSGVLCFVALLLGAGRCVGCDVDPAAAFHARENTELNRDRLGVSSPFWLVGRSDALSSRFDVVLVNVLLERIRADVDGVVACVAPGGRLLVSGFQPRERSEVLALWSGAGLELVAERQLEDWGCLELGRRGS